MEQNLYALRITRYIHMRKNEREKEKVLEIIERERLCTGSENLDRKKN